MTLNEGSPFLRVLRNRDFRILWLGAFVSFTGGQISTLAQGYFVYQITGNEAMLALVPFVWAMPVFIFGLAAGSFADRFDKRKVLTICMLLYAANSFFLAAGTGLGFITYPQIIFIAALNGLVATIEMPTRQSVVSRVVPPEDLAAAVPVNAMTFNTARIVGPAVGAALLAKLGVFACYLFDGISFLAIIGSVTMIKSDLSSRSTSRGPIRDLVIEGALYAMRDVRLRTLFFLELATALFGLSFAALLPAYAHLLSPAHAAAVQGLGSTSIGAGALIGLIVVTQLADSPHKGWIIRGAMVLIAIGLLGMAVVREPLAAYPLLAMAGAGGIMQLNSTNALFQILAPERLHGRVLAMHIWALNGLSPFGVLAFGWLAKASKGYSNLPVEGGVPLTYGVAGVIMTFVFVTSLFARKGLRDLHREVEVEAVPGASLR